jgi:3-oxoacyl-[acyl-carrier protein] reductase
MRFERVELTMDELSFGGKTVLVVGGSSGIGNGIAQAFAEHGAAVYIWGTRPSADDYASVEGSNLTGLHYDSIDVADRDAIDAYAACFKTLDVLVLCQGTVIYRRGEFERAGWDKVISINLDSLMACAMKFRAMLKHSRGSMIMVSSTSAFHATRGNPAYAASKAGAVGLTRTLGEAWAPEGFESTVSLRDLWIPSSPR